MDGMQGGIGTDHAERLVLGYQQDMRDVAAVPLIEVPALLGQVQGFAAADVFEINDGIGDAALRADDEALEIGHLFRIGVADLRVFGDGHSQGMRKRPGPLDGARDGAAVNYGDDFVGALRKSNRRGEKENREPASRKHPSHTRPLECFGNGNLAVYLPRS